MGEFYGLLTELNLCIILKHKTLVKLDICQFYECFVSMFYQTLFAAKTRISFKNTNIVL